MDDAVALGRHADRGGSQSRKASFGPSEAADAYRGRSYRRKVRADDPQQGGCRQAMRGRRPPSASTSAPAVPRACCCGENGCVLATASCGLSAAHATARLDRAAPPGLVAGHGRRPAAAARPPPRCRSSPRWGCRARCTARCSSTHDGEPIRPALLWNDGRTHAECDEIDRRVGRDRVIAITGNPRQHRFPGAQAAVAAPPRAGAAATHRQAAAAQGLHPPATDRRPRHRCRRRIGHAVPGPSASAATAARCWKRSTCPKTCCRRSIEGPGGHGPDQRRCGRGADRPARRHARRRRRRRQCLCRHRVGPDRRGPRRLLDRHLRARCSSTA